MCGQGQGLLGEQGWVVVGIRGGSPDMVEEDGREERKRREPRVSMRLFPSAVTMTAMMASPAPHVLRRAVAAGTPGQIRHIRSSRRISSAEAPFSARSPEHDPE